MRKKTKINLIIGCALLLLFIAYTVTLKFVDVQAIGPQNSIVAYATINQAVHGFFGVHTVLYQITDWASIAAFALVFGFAALGLAQWIKRKSFVKIDSSILVLGAFYLAVLAVYLLFEFVVINHRPVLIEGVLEVSYPSSTTVLATCVLVTAMLQFERLITNNAVKISVLCVCGAFAAFLIIGRLISGVHWFTDILGGLLISAAFIMLYCAANGIIADKTEAKKQANV